MKQIDCYEIYSSGAHYDAQHKGFEVDIPFYIKRVEEFGDPVLELASGTGRVTIELAKKGIDITGLEISEAMLGQAKKKAKELNLNIDWVLADCRDFSLDRKYALVIFPYNAIAHLHDLESIEACFAKVREHLVDGGHFIIDMFNPSVKVLSRAPNQRFPVAEYPSPETGELVRITEEVLYDSAAQINYIKWFYKIGDKEDICRELNMRMFFPQELDALLKYNGFFLENKYGDWSDTPFDINSNFQLVVCRKK